MPLEIPQDLMKTLNKPMDASPEVDSVHEKLDSAVGSQVTKVITLSASNTTASENIFQITGTVEITSLHGGIADTTVLTNLTAAHFDLYDSTAAVDITRNQGVLSGLAVGTFFVKDGAVANDFSVCDNVAGAICEPASGNRAFAPFLLTQKTGANTFVRFTYTTTDAPINAQLRIEIRYIAHHDGNAEGTLVAV